MKVAVTGKKSFHPMDAELRSVYQFYEKVPDLKAEVMKVKASQFAGVSDSAIKLLEDAVIASRSMWINEMAISEEGAENYHFEDSADLFKLLGTSDPHKLEWFYKSDKGDVYGKQI